jgi:hypothetical protein
MSKLKEQACDLCSLPVPPLGPHLALGDRELVFCCESCRGIWQMLNQGAAPAPIDNKGKSS